MKISKNMFLLCSKGHFRSALGIWNSTFGTASVLAIDAIGYWARRCLQSSLAASIQASRFIQTSECSFESEENRFNMVMGSIPINTIFSGMNIHLPAILGFTRGTRVLTHCHILKPLRLSDGVDEGRQDLYGFPTSFSSRCPHGPDFFRPDMTPS